MEALYLLPWVYPTEQEVNGRYLQCVRLLAPNFTNFRVIKFLKIIY